MCRTVHSIAPSALRRWHLQRTLDAKEAPKARMSPTAAIGRLSQSLNFPCQLGRCERKGRELRVDASMSKDGVRARSSGQVDDALCLEEQIRMPDVQALQ
ncbi:unnamed protein product [Symbiodinium sp. CCMP2456]|nr:unnamed protein product [Symbiodinium sp. CCMP2456]